MRKIFSVYISGKHFDVYDIPEKVHDGYNGIPRTWWLYFSAPLPGGLLPPADSDSFIPFSSHINRRVWEVEFKEHAYPKEKWGDISIRNSCFCRMWCNGKVVYEFTCHKMDFAVHKAEYLKVVMSEHSYNFFEPETEMDRKIWFQGLPATIKPRKQEGWSIVIYPDYSVMPKNEWWKEYERRNPQTYNKENDMLESDLEELSEDMRDDCINWGDVLGGEGKIWWHRK